MRLHLWLAATVLLLGSVNAAASPPVQAWIGSEYALGAVAEGRIIGNMSATAFYFREARTGNFEFQSDGGTWTEFTTEVNYTVTGPGGPDSEYREVSRRQWNQSFDVPEGPGLVSWDRNGTARIYGSPGPLRPGISFFSVLFDSSFVRSKPFIPDEPRAYFVKRGGTPAHEATGLNVYTYLGGVRGWNRFVEIADGDLRVDGNLTVYLEHATLSVGPSWERSLPSRWDNITRTPTPGAGLVSAQFHHAFVDLRNVRLVTAAGPVFGQGLRAHVDGLLSISGAAGRLETGERTVPFDGRELAVGGSFEWYEKPTTTDTSQKAMMAAGLAGEFQTVNLDLGAVFVAPAQANLLVKVGLWATVIAIALALAKLVAFLFSRLRDDELDQHALRRRLLDAVGDNAGIGVWRLAELIDAKPATVWYHLRYMESHHVVSSKKVGRERRFFAGANIGRSEREVRKEFDEPVQALVSYVPETGCALSDAARFLCEKLEMSRSSAYAAIERAQEAKLVSRTKTEHGWWIACE